MRLAAILLLFAACSAPRGSVPDGGSAPDAGLALDAGLPADAGTGPRLGTPEEAAAFVHEVRLAACRHFTKCVGGELARAASLDPELCADVTAGRPLESIHAFGLPLDGLLDGRRQLDLDKADRCRAAMARLECPHFPNPYPFEAACRDVGDGLVPDGGACGSPLDCAGHALCVKSGNLDCEGTCKVVDDASCIASSECAPGEFCDRPGNDGGHCAPRAKPGEHCGSHALCVEGFVCTGAAVESMTCQPDEPAPCATGCAAGERCDTSRRAHCVAAVPLGASCASSPCEVGTFCNAAKVCEPVHAVGEACAGRDECAGGRCWNGRCGPDYASTCDADSCAVWSGPGNDELACRPLAIEGERCSSCLDGRACARGLFCDDTFTCRAGEPPVKSCFAARNGGSVCVAPPTGGLDDGALVQVPVGYVGAPCTRDGPAGECARDLRCLADANGELRCTTPPADRDPCGHELCGIGERCVVEPDHCVPAADLLPQEGEACLVTQLRTGLCADDTLVCAPTSEAAGTCRIRRSPGEPCTNIFDCGGMFADHLCDIGGTNTCVKRPGPGEPCRMFGRVGLCDATRAWCDDRASPPTCRAFRHEGEACVDRVECGYLMGLGSCASEPETGPRVCWSWAFLECH